MKSTVKTTSLGLLSIMLYGHSSTCLCQGQRVSTGSALADIVKEL